MSDKIRLDLNDLVPLWERKFTQLPHEPKIDGEARRDMDFTVTALGEDFGRNAATLTQDVVRALIVRQCRVKR
jgi:hypothetical protein